MKTPSMLFSDTYAVTRRCRVLWLLQSISSVLGVILITILLQYSVVPLIEQYRSVRESSELDTDLIASLPDHIMGIVYAAIPLIVVIILVSMLMRICMYAAIPLCVSQASVTVRSALGRGMRYFPIILGVSVVLACGGLLVSAVGAMSDIVLAFAGFVSIVQIVLGLIVVCAGYFAWPCIIIGKSSIGASLLTSMKLVLHNMWLVALMSGTILLLDTVMACLLGAALGVGYYLSLQGGIILCDVILIALIPIRVYMHVAYTLLYLSCSGTNPS